MKKITTLLFAICIGIAAFATDYTVGDDQTSTNTQYLPMVIAQSSGASYFITQQLYLASELSSKGASVGEITDVTFTYVGNGTNVSLSNPARSIEVWIREVSISDFSESNWNNAPCTYAPNSSTQKSGGAKVFDGSVNLPQTANTDYTITFNNGSFNWNGTSNLLITIVDKTGNTIYNFNRYHSGFSASNRGMYATSSSSTFSAEDLYRRYTTSRVNSIPIATFTFSAASIPSIPTELSANTTTNSASLSWNSVSGATSYKLQQSANGADWNELEYGVTSNLYNWTGLLPEATYYVRIAASNASGDSDYSDPISFTTDAVHSHNGVEFDKWNTSSDMPLSGNYYLAGDVNITAYVIKNISGSLKLCLNGNTLAFSAASGGIHINDGGSLEIYDVEGSGVVTSPNGTATIQVASGGSLTIHGGMVQNSNDANKTISCEGDLSIDLSDAVSNAAYISLVNGKRVDVSMTRSLTSSQYNTFCLPFALTNVQLAELFGSGYDLQELYSSSLNGEELSLEFNKVTSLVAGKPYLIKPAHDVSNPSFEGVTIAATSAGTTETSYIDFKGIYSPTELESNKNLLFLGAGNELFWPESTGNMNGFRAYFEVKGDAQKAAKHARIVQSQDAATALDQTESARHKAEKFIRNGQLIIERNGFEYNAQGQLMK